MVHSDSASSMKTTPSPSTSPDLTSSPLQGAPSLLQPSTDSAVQDQSHIPTKLCHTELTPNLDATQPTDLTVTDANASVVTPAKPLTANSSPTSDWSSSHTPSALGAVNGRTSGRKRTPKACDCCGLNSQGHNVRTQGRGRGRGRSRGRWTGRDLQDTSRREAGGKLTHITTFDLTGEQLEEAEDGDDTHGKDQMAEADTQSPLSPAALPFHVSQMDSSIRNCGFLEKGDVQEDEKTLIEVLGAAVSEEERVGNTLDVARQVLELTGSRGREDRTMEGEPHVATDPRSDALTGSASAASENAQEEMDRDEQTCSCSDKSEIGNSETIDLSETEHELEAKDDMDLVEPGNGLLSISWKCTSAFGPNMAQALDSEMQVDQTFDRTDDASLSVTYFNGDTVTPIDTDHKSTQMEVETSHKALVSPPSRGPIAVYGTQHCWALRDHALYCQLGTWEKAAVEALSMELSKDTDLQEENGELRASRSREQLVDMVHEFLEGFYIKYGSFIPLSEADVLEHLMKKGNYDDLSNKGLNIQGEMSRYRAGLASAPVAGFMVMYNKHTLSLEDLSTLEEQNWLNDQIINMYGELIMEATQHKVHFFNSFFHKQLVAKGYEGVKRWTKKVDLFSKWLLLIPIHLEIHWSLVTVTMATKTINYYDSQGIVFRHTTDNIMKYLQSEAREKKQTAFQKGWKITIIKGIPQQKNDSDCGVFVLEYCRCLSVKQPLLFSQEDMPRIRKRIYKELCDRRLND